MTCSHGRTTRCPITHDDDDPRLGTPICPDCYDYTGAAAFNAKAPELWRRFTIALRRRCADELELPERQLGSIMRISFAKVAEFQARGVVHFHAIIRLDGPEVPYAPWPANLSNLDLPNLMRESAASGFLAASTDDGVRALRFGDQLDIRRVVGDTDDDGHVTPQKVAAYIAKYSTKAAEDFGLISGVRTAEAAALHGLSPHVVRMLRAVERLATQPEFAGIERWVHMLGFRGHFTTKSRAFSVTLGELRGARAAHRQADGFPLGDGIDRAGVAGHSESTLVVGSWKFRGLGHLSPGDLLLTTRVYTEHLEALDHAREEQQLATDYP
ncbi:hypothetical protein HKD39_04130 [Nakamurella sp. DB0629]|uniref:Replication initiation protein n=1 Tax=Nakamurella aerolata TaxID=1656892 RepID=A0A849A734_9ACTN|nr:replication initiator [Nakamurella aerolata]NNG34918.1 hypothetical protein [Nakamurella aerolata]